MVSVLQPSPGTKPQCMGEGLQAKNEGLFSQRNVEPADKVPRGGECGILSFTVKTQQDSSRVLRTSLRVLVVICLAQTLAVGEIL